MYVNTLLTTKHIFILYFKVFSLLIYITEQLTDPITLTSDTSCQWQFYMHDSVHSNEKDLPNSKLFWYTQYNNLFCQNNK